MLGFAIVQSDAQSIAIWLVSCNGSAAANTNAVVLPTASDSDVAETVGSLVHDRVILGDAAILDRLGAKVSESVSLDAVETWDRDRQARQMEMNAFVERTSKAWKIPFQDTALLPLPPGDPGDASARALSLADYLRRVWTKWLATETERTRRAVENKNRVPEALASTGYCGVPLAGLEGHQWAGSSLGPAHSSSDEPDGDC